MSNKKNPPQEYEVTLRVKVTVSNFSEEDKVLPTLPQVMEAWESYTGPSRFMYRPWRSIVKWDVTPWRSGRSTVSV